MLQPPHNRFTLIYEGVETEFTPRNWSEFECVLSRERMAVDQTVGQTTELFGAAADVVTTAYASGLPVVFRLEVLDNEWQYSDTWTFLADMETYSEDGGIVSVGWIENTVRDEIDKSKGTKYDIDVPNVYGLSYTGITNNKVNEVTALMPAAIPILNEYVVPCENIAGWPSNWVIRGIKTKTTVSDTLIFTDYDGFYIRCIRDTDLTIKLTLGKILIQLDSRDSNITIKLVHARKSGDSWYFMNELHSEYKYIRLGSDYYNIYKYEFNNDIEFTFTNTGSGWQKSWDVGKVHYSYTIGDTDFRDGDFIALVVNCKNKSSVLQYKNTDESDNTVLTIESVEVSNFINYPISVMSIETVLTSLLAKMCVTPPALTYNLPKYNEAGYWIPVLSSGSALQHSATPKISVSFEDVMKMLQCVYGASYDVGSTLVVDYDTAYFLTDNGDMSNLARTIEYSDNINVEYDSEHVYSKVEAGWDTDDDVECGVQEIVCKNVFTVNDKSKDKTLDLVCPFKGSPFTIEQYLNDKAGNTEKTKTQDNDVFVFCVSPFVSANTTTLYKKAGAYSGHDTYYNLPLTPMRFLIANAKYLGVSLYNRAKQLVFVSTERKADVTTQIDGETDAVTENSGVGSTLVSGLATPLFLPEKVSFDFYDEVPTKAEIDADRHKYFAVVDKKTGGSYNVYINDLSLPLTVGKKQTFDGIRK